MSGTSAQALRRTPLYALHKRMGAKLVDFHGWELPVQFSSILKEHEAVRSAAGLFDVSHMGQVTVEGPGALEFVQLVCSNDASKLAPGQAMYAHMLNEKGGVVDDVIVSRLGPERFFIVVNASTAEKDFAWLKRHAPAGLALADRSAEFGMLALQGPRAAEIVKGLVPAAAGLARFGALEAPLYGQLALVTRTGYTGEDGFELVVPEAATVRLWEDLAAAGASRGLLPCGLGARDTLRLEAGYLLYGQDIDEEHTPLEAGYDWVVKFAKKAFIGKEALERQKREGVQRRLTGLRLLERGVPRSGTPVFRGDAQAGTLASATFSPTLQAGIGVGYLSPAPEPGTRLEVSLHGRKVPAEVVKIPFYRGSR